MKGYSIKMTNTERYTKPFLAYKRAQPGPGSYNLEKGFKAAAVVDRVAPTMKLRPLPCVDDGSRSPSP